MSRVEHEVAIVGAGFSGLGMAIELKRAGREDFAIFERGDAVGGTWRDNRYPGCACDVPTPLYSFSFAPNPEWSYLYARSDEIRTYLEACVARFGIEPQLTLNNGLASARWHERRQLWELTLDDGSTTTARLLVSAIGGPNRPSFPEIEGIGDFAGPLMHSAAWDHRVDLAGKRVAVIGTGASAIQLVPRVAESTAHLDVFQRTPPWVMPQTDFRIPAAVKRLFHRLPPSQRALRALIWAIQESLAIPLTRFPALTRPLEAYARAHLRRAVGDPELRARLTPSYKLGCKRILFSNDYYPALARPDVELVTDPIARITAGGIETAAGELLEADVLVCATGFDIREALAQADVRGRGGVSLAELWSRRIEGHRGTMVHGFPNLVVMSGPNTGTGNMSQVFMIESQIRFTSELLAMMRRRGAVEVEVRREAQDAYNRALVARMAGTVWLGGGCDSWYLTEEGHSGVLYPGFSTAFRRSLRRVDEREYVLSPPRSEPIPEPREPAFA